MEPAAISSALAAFAKQELAGVIARGEGTQIYDRFVNGHAGAPEESVQAPGPILYVFSWWQPIIAFALNELERRSPRKSGRYANSFVVFVNGRRAHRGEEIPPNAEVVITNTQPYARKVQVGAMKMNVPPFLFDYAGSAVVRRFGATLISVQLKFLQLRGGYILKRSQGNRADRQAGMPLTYPSLILNMKQ
ncbi:hypothetical protein J2X65_003151 [Ancylobacter sp. 3268]|uniref:hypothetical protein n=1 Tax=Ancylobacter sp. 3268 TaxID=2817752 RepID=UPI0028560C7A|nr:hypothetical protein [Ancylobacter sp. 3268]MDR6953788.1 hypothetical protein [Ancylobacter sp. 3268]